MSRSIRFFAIPVLLLFVALATPRAPATRAAPGNPAGGRVAPAARNGAAPDRLMVTLKPGVPSDREAKLHASANANVIRTVEQLRLRVIQVPAQRRDAALHIYRASPDVLAVELDRIVTTDETPNDTRYAEQWALNTIEAAAAWDRTQGLTSVLIAILDTGIESTHPDLASKVVLAQNFSDSPSVTDRDGHGTHVAGIAAAATNNAIGVAGLAREALLLNVKVLGDSGSGYTSDVAEGIVWAADNGAQVINMSLGGSGACSTGELNAVNYAWSKGVVLVAAAGNQNSSGPFSPAACPNVVSVAATDITDARASFSNYGTTVDIAAPGVDILSTALTGDCRLCDPTGYTVLNGTSMASPFVAGLAALVWSTGFNTSNQTVVDRMMQTADAVAGTGTLWRAGRLNARRAVSPLTIAEARPAFVYDGLTSDADTTQSLTELSANWESMAGVAAIGYEYAIGTTAGGAETLPFTDAGPATRVTQDGLALIADTTYYVTVRAYDAAGTRSAARSADGVKVDRSSPVITAVSDAPDPFSPKGEGKRGKQTTTLAYTLSKDAAVTVRVYDAAGALIRTLVDGATRTMGAHREVWNGQDVAGVVVADGTYSYQIDAIDDASQAAVSQSGTSRVDTIGPTLTIVEPAGPVTTLAGQYRLKATMAPADGGYRWTARDLNHNGQLDPEDYGQGGPVMLGATEISTDIYFSREREEDVPVYLLQWGEDAAGNWGPPAVVPPITNNAYAPNAPRIADPYPPSTGLADAASYTLRGTADANSLVQVVKDSNKDQFPDPNEPVVGVQQLTDGATSYAISVPLAQNTDNFFHVYASDAVRQSGPSFSVQIKENATPPVLSSVSASPSTFSPNGDGHRDYTVITFAVNQPARVTIGIYDAAGILVVPSVTDSQLLRSAGVVYSTAWYGDGGAGGGKLAPGTYTYRISVVDTLGRVGAPRSGTVKISSR
ncbi:MAG TPA: S8 family serine peptidase [Herpetosiphonaceae bacterium]|nr:S8 family serine peptidase [Herpetosiphonaceae bacterium]